MSYNGKTEITKEEYLQLLGLKLLAEGHEKALKEINLGVLSILQERGLEVHSFLDTGDGWSGELVYTERSVDDILKICKIEVIDG